MRLTLLFCCLCSLALALDELPFDPGVIVEQVTQARGETPRPCPPDTVEFMLDTVPLGYTRTADPVFAPAVASNGTDYLVVWKAVGGDWPIRGARVSGSGALLDSTGFVICSSTVDSRAGCAAVWGDSTYLVLWQHQSYSIRGAFVTSEGRVRPGQVIVADSTPSHYDPAVAFDGIRFIAAWHSSPDGNYRWDIRATPVSTAGEVRYLHGLRVLRGLSLLHTSQRVSVATRPSASLVAWESNQAGPWDILGMVLDSAGLPPDTVPIVIAGEGEDARMAAVATDGADFLVAWRAGEGALADIHAARVSATGEVIDRHPIAVCAHSHAQEEPSVAFDGTNYVVAWQDWRNGNRDIYGARVTPGGVVLDPDGTRWTDSPQDETEPAIAVGDSSCFVAWLDYRWPNDADVFATRISRDGAVLDSAFPVPDTQALGRDFAGQYLPDVAFDGENYLVVWEDHRTAANQWDIYGIRVSPDGGVLEAVPFAISTGAGAQQAPAVAFGDSTYFVVWEDYRNNPGNGWDIFGARVSRSGVVLDPDGIPVMPRYSRSERVPAIAFDGENYLVVWQTEGVTALCGRFVDQAGHPLGDSFFVLNDDGEAAYPALTAGDSCYLATWNGTYAIRVTHSGTVLDTIRIRPNAGTMTTVGFDGSRFCVASQGSQPSSVVFGSRLTQQGEVLDSGGVVLRRSGTSHAWPDIAFDGQDYILVWQERSTSYDWTLYGARVDPSLFGVDTFRLSANPGVDQTPAVASGTGGQSFVVFACTTAASLAHGARAFRIWARFLQNDGSPVEPLPPRMLRPPPEYQFNEPPVVLLVDSTRVDVDSFEFVVLAWQPTGDTIWHQVALACSCAIPDSTLENIRYYWQCRVRDTLGQWSSYTPASKFWVLYLPTGIQQEPGGGVPVLGGASVARRGRPLVCAGPGGVPGPWRLDVYATDGRRVVAIEPGADGALAWDWRDAAGRPVAAGLYIVRLTGPSGRTVQRRYVLLD